MTEDLTRLVREIERVITAPYVPSLQDLYSLAQNLNPSQIKIWTLQKPCQVGLLAGVLVESLSRSRIALPLLSTFAMTACFRDAMLNRHPVALDTFLEKAMNYEESDYTAACVSMLSSPLPSTMVAPGRLPDFIMKLVSAMASNPCTETIAPLHMIMGILNGSPRLLNEIPDEIMANLQLELTKPLRNMEDHMGILMSLATFARISSTQSEHQSPLKKHGSEPPAWLLNIQHFFGPKRGQKTLDLVVLRVILACSSSSSFTPSQAADSIRLAVSIVDNIDRDQKISWVASGSSKVAKLCDKVVRDGLDREVQLMGLTFLLSICPVEKFPPQIRNLGLRLLISKDSRVALSTMESHLVIRLTKSLATCDESIIYELLRFTVDAVKDKNMNRGSLSNLHVASLLLSSFQQAESNQVISSLLSSASTKETIASLFGQFPSQTSQVQCEGSEICYCAYTALQNQILRSLFEMYFAAALSQNGNARDVDIIKSFVGRVPMSLEKCSFVNAEPSNFRTSLLLRDRRELSSLQHPSRDWRYQITDTFIQHSRVANDSMLQKVEDICFDMERRCYDVEGPLRSAEADRNEHMLEVERLRRENENLEHAHRQNTQAMSDLRQEMARLEEQAESACNRVEELSASLNSAHDELQEQILHSAQDFQLEKDRARSRELDLIATFTEKDDQLEELQGKLHRLQSENEKMRQSLDVGEQEKESFSETLAFLQRDIEEHKQALEQQRTLCSEKEREIQRLFSVNGNLKMETENLKSMMIEQTQEAERLHNSLQQAEETSRSERQAMRQKHEAQISNNTAEVTKLKEENKRLHREVQDGASEATKKIQAKDKRMVQLEKKVQSMRDEREAKAREFSEAQQHIGRLMGVMGFSAQPTEPAQPKPQQPRSMKQSKPAAHRPDAYNDEDSQLVESFESMASNFNQRTPKRPRGNRLSQPSQPQPQTRGLPISKSSPHISESARRLTRKPLGEADLNSPTKSPNANNLKHNQPTAATTDHFEDNCLEDLDLDMDLEFSRDFIFTSTAFSGSDDKSALQ